MYGRRRAIAHIRRIAIDDAEELGRMEFAETKIGRLEHKIEKLKVLGEKVPGVEFITSEVFSGDHGLAVIEHAPFVVIAAITPVTHSLPTIGCNAINMIAAGNSGWSTRIRAVGRSPPRGCGGSMPPSTATSGSTAS